MKVLPSDSTLAQKVALDAEREPGMREEDCTDRTNQTPVLVQRCEIANVNLYPCSSAKHMLDKHMH